MSNLPPKIKKALHRYAEQASDIELGRALEALSHQFDAWKTGALTNAELSQAIHRFHNGPAVELYKKYSYTDLPFVVAAAIVTGILPREKIEPEVMDHLRNHIAFLERDK